MYTEEYEANGFPLRKFLLRLIFALIFICLLIWLVPKFTSSRIENNNKTDLSPTKDRTFMSNLEKMQAVGVDYYTEQRLPKEVGKSAKLTLYDMVQKKLIVPLVDRNDKICDMKKSYVKMTKLEKEYLMKINLKCEAEEDYLLIHLGAYKYCDSAVCPKEEITIEEEKSKQKKEVAFGKNTSAKSKTKPSSDLAINADEITAEGATNEPTEEKPQWVVGYQYEYKKAIGSKYSDWSSWTPWQHTSCQTTAYGCNDQDPGCLKKVQVFKRKEQVGTYNKEYVAARNKVIYTNSYQKGVCSNYDYISYNNKTYLATAPYSTINNVTSTTGRNIDGWQYNGRKTYVEPPHDTLTTRYIYVSADFSNCRGTCEVAPKKIYDVYTYTGSIGVVTSTTTSGSIKNQHNQTIKINCNQTVNKTVPIYATITTYEKALRKEALYGTVCYASEKTRSLLSQGNIDTKWSNYNDQKLLSNGYYYTGNKRQKG